MVWWLRSLEDASVWFESGSPEALKLTRAADLLELLSNWVPTDECLPPTPIPVSERLPGPEDCDAEGRCWWLTSECEGQFSWELLPNNELRWSWSHWLPARALPLPSGEV